MTFCIAVIADTDALLKSFDDLNDHVNKFYSDFKRSLNKLRNIVVKMQESEQTNAILAANVEVQAETTSDSNLQSMEMSTFKKVHYLKQKGILEIYLTSLICFLPDTYISVKKQSRFCVLQILFLWCVV